MNYKKTTPIRISLILCWIILQINPLHAEKISENKNSIAENNPNHFLHTDSTTSLQEAELLPYPANKETNERYHSFAIRAGVGSWIQKAGAGAGGAMLTMDIPGENESKFGWLYSLELGMELALSRHFSLVADYYFMKSFFKYKGYTVVPDGTMKFQHHTGLLGISYYF